MLPDFLSDISIHYECVPPHVIGAVSRGVLWEAAPGRFLLEAPDTARYLVENGNRIVIEPVPLADEGDVHLFLRMTPLAALLFQRGAFAFHAAAVAGPAGAILIAGDSGSGKSTLLAAMLQRGWKLLSDDLAVVDSNENGIPIVFPTFPEMTLWPDSMERLGIQGRKGGMNVIFHGDGFTAAPQPLRAICRLSVHKEETAFSDIQGTKVFSTLTALSYNSRIADVLLDRVKYMRLASSIAGNVSVRALRRARSRWSAEELADLLEREYR